MFELSKGHHRKAARRTFLSSPSYRYSFSFPQKTFFAVLDRKGEENGNRTLGDNAGRGGRVQQEASVRDDALLRNKFQTSTDQRIKATIKTFRPQN